MHAISTSIQPISLALRQQKVIGLLSRLETARAPCAPPSLSCSLSPPSLHDWDSQSPVQSHQESLFDINSIRQYVTVPRQRRFPLCTGSQRLSKLAARNLEKQNRMKRISAIMEHPPLSTLPGEDTVRQLAVAPSDLPATRIRFLAISVRPAPLACQHSPTPVSPHLRASCLLLPYTQQPLITVCFQEVEACRIRLFSYCSRLCSRLRTSDCLHAAGFRF